MLTRDHPRLGQVVAERGEDHPVQPFGRHADSLCETRARPGLTSHVGILRAELESASRTVVEAVPEADRAFDVGAGIRSALRERPRIESRSDCSRRRSLGVAAGIVELRRPISNVGFCGSVVIGRTGVELRSGVSVYIEFLAMPLKRGQSLTILDQVRTSVSMDGQIGELGSAVPADSAAAESVQTKHDVFVVEIPASIRSNATTVFGNVVGAFSAGTRPRAAWARSGSADSEVCAGEYAVTKTVIQTEDLVVSKTRIERDLSDDVRRWVKCIRARRCASGVKSGAGCTGGGERTSAATGDRVVVAIGCACGTKQEVVGVSVGCKRALRILHGYGERDLVVEVFGNANSVLAREGKPNVISRIDGHGPGVVGSTQIVAGLNSLFIFGDQTPHLAAEKAPSIIELRLSPSLAKAERVTVGLSGCRGIGGGQKVGRYVAGELNILQAAIDIHSRP